MVMPGPVRAVPAGRKANVARLTLPPVTMRTVSTLTPLGSVTLTTSRATFPMVPLPPGDRLGGIEGGGEGEGRGGGDAVDVEREGRVALRRVEEVGHVGAGRGGLDREVEPFARLGPADVEQAEGRDHLVAG